MEDRETARMRKYGESKTTRIMMATVPHVTSGLGLRKFQADGLLLTRVYIAILFVRSVTVDNAVCREGVEVLKLSVNSGTVLVTEHGICQIGRRKSNPDTATFRKLHLYKCLFLGHNN